MEVWKKHWLKKGAVLDDRYVIDGILGEGGFGITYSALNRLSGMRVAVKEYFCREYMSRDAEKGDAVDPVAPAEQARFQEESSRFVKEARALRDFAGCEGIVRIEDYFEANGTAYIVMELLEGMTLKQYVREHGRMPAEQIFRRLSPLLAALEKIHEAGMVHRDISPDNIMMGPDGALTLMDFGAARSYSDENITHSLIYKEGFAPQEQFDRRGQQLGPYTDLYSVCATAYYCVTGEAPVDSIMRVLYDDLKAPSALGIPIQPEAEDLIMRGLALKQEKRWQSAGDLLERIRKIWPDPDPDRTARLRRRRRWIAGAAAVVLMMAAFFGYRYYRAHEVELKFRNLETCTFYLFPSEGMDEAAWQKTLPRVRDRVRVLAGKEYLWQEEGRRVELVIAKELFQELDPGEIVSSYIAGAMKLELHEPRPSLNYVSLNREDINGIEKVQKNGSDYVRLTLSDEAASAFDVDFKEAGHRLLLFEDFEYTRFGTSLGLDTDTEGDGNSILLENNYEGSLYDLFTYSMTEEPLEAPLRCVYDEEVMWERTEDNPNAGIFQTAAENLGGETVWIRLKEDFFSGTVERAAARMMVKNRLDSVGKPYALGVPVKDEGDIIIKIHREDYLDVEIKSLGSIGDVKLTDAWGKNADLWISHDTASYMGLSISGSSLEAVDGDNGAWELRLNIRPLDATRESVKSFLDDLKKRGEEYVYLSSGENLLARAAVSDALETIRDDRISFSRLMIPGYEALDSKTRGFGSYLEKYEGALVFVVLTNNQVLGFDGEGKPTGEEVSLQGCLYADLEEEAAEIAEAGTLTDKRGREGGYDAFFDSSTGELIVYFSELGREGMIEDGLQRIEDFRKAHHLEDGRFPNIRFYLFPDNIRWKTYELLYYKRNAEKSGMVYENGSENSGLTDEENAAVLAFCG